LSREIISRFDQLMPISIFQYLSRAGHATAKRLGPGLFVIIMILTPALAKGQGGQAALEMPSADDPVAITADEVAWLRKENRLELSGNVTISHPEYVVRADRAEAELDKNIIRASGAVTVARIENGVEGEILTSEEVEINVETGAGWMVEARLRVPSQDAVLQFEGKRVERIDDHTYLIEEGRFTWCDCEQGETPDWSVAAESIEADTEGDAVAQGARVYIRDLQVMMIPYFRYPVSTRRRSGFLMPEIETSSSDGVQIEIPYYWVISRSADLTVGPRYIQERGVDAGTELRYNYGDIAHGEMRGFGIDDAAEHVSRGGIRIVHRADIGDRFTAASDVSLITDNEVLFDFDHRNLGDENRRELESRLYLSYHWTDMNLTAELAAFDDLMGGDVRDSPFGRDRDEEMVQRLPAVQYTLLTRPLIGPVYFDVQAYAANYYRQEAEMGRGQMVSILPRVALPYRLFDSVDFWFAAGYREWMAAPDPDFDEDSTATGRAEAELYTSAQWERIFEEGGHRYRHTVRPELIGFYGGEPQDVKDDFFQTVIPAYATELLGAHLDSRLFSKPAKQGPAPVTETARFELTQLYDFEQELWRDLRVEGRLGPPTPWRLNLDLYHSWEEWEWSRIVSGIGYVLDKTAELRFGYREDTGNVRAPYFEFQAAKDAALTGEAFYSINRVHEFGYKAHYSIEHDRVVRQSFEYDYLARQKCWALNLKVSDRIKPDEPDEDHEVSGSVNFRIEAPSGM
jgi:LPS-assembly protein